MAKYNELFRLFCQITSLLIFLRSKHSKHRQLDQERILAASFFNREELPAGQGVLYHKLSLLALEHSSKHNLTLPNVSAYFQRLILLK